MFKGNEGLLPLAHCCVFYTKKIVVALQWWACRINNPDGDHSTVINWSTLNEHPGHRSMSS